MMNDKDIRLDRMRYTKNTLSSGLCYLAIVFDVLYFVSIYKSDVGTWYYNILPGVSIIYNLLFMLFVFLGSEAVKNYRKSFTLPLFGLGIIQIARIFILPYKAHNAYVKLSGVETAVMGNPQFIRCIVYLVISALCLCAAAYINLHKCRALEKYMKTLNKKA